MMVRVSEGETQTIFTLILNFFYFLRQGLPMQLWMQPWQTWSSYVPQAGLEFEDPPASASPAGIKSVHYNI